MTEPSSPPPTAHPVDAKPVDLPTHHTFYMWVMQTDNFKPYAFLSQNYETAVQNQPKRYAQEEGQSTRRRLFAVSIPIDALEPFV